MNVNGKEVKMSEFEYIYNKNNSEEAIDKRSLDEYVELFKNFKLKVAEAEAQGLDTTASFHKELKEYRTQLARPYLTLDEPDESLLKNVYDRDEMYNEVSVILIPFPPFERKESSFTLTPSDTLETYGKALEVRKEAMKKNANFEELVGKYSADENSKKNTRPGYLGWLSNMNLLPIFEVALVSTPKGQVSMPVRTSIGYYLLKIHDKIANPGEVHAAHILISCPQDADTVQVSDAEKKVKEIQLKLKEGDSFEELAKEFSEDPGSGPEGGDLSWFSFGQMVPEFNDMAFSMTETGSVSEPVKTRFGYHFIKLLGKRGRADFDAVKSQIKNKLERTGYFYELYAPKIEQMKKEHHYSQNTSVYDELVKDAQIESPIDTIYIKKISDNQSSLFSLGNKTFSVADFAEHLTHNTRSFYNVTTEILKDKYNQFLYNKLIEAEDESLESRFSEFRNLMQEYRDGILLFEVSNNEVWEKASVDTIGLANFFEANKLNYKWDEPRWKGYVVLIKNAKNKKQMQKKVSKMAPDDAAGYLSENYVVEGVPQVKLEKNIYKEGQNPFVDELIFKTGKAELPDEYQDFFLVGKLLPDNMPENYKDIRGLVITDYQNQLEKDWLDYLNKKYSVHIYQNVIDTLKK
jgi:peptidyl-prolyl cis-trans isomerase SurA